MKPSRVGIEFVGGPRCGEQLSIERDGAGDPPSTVDTNYHRGMDRLESGHLAYLYIDPDAERRLALLRA